MNVSDIINELNEDNGSNYKMDVLRKYPDHELLQRVLKMAYDRATYTYGISMKNINILNIHYCEDWSLEGALDLLEKRYVTREFTGNEAKFALERVFAGLSKDNVEIVKGVINRDLRINMGRSNINKIFKGLIVKPVYMRCGLYNEKTAKKINPVGSYVQLKADGTYREFTVEDGVVSTISRSGQEYSYPTLTTEMQHYPDGVYHGELTVYEKGRLLIRSIGNGIINSDDFTGYVLKLDLWDHITLEEYSGAVKKVKGTTPYHERFDRLTKIVNAKPVPHIEVIETHVVQSISEALQHTSDWMNKGLEGAILKDKDAIFRDGTSPQQLKLKLEIDAEVRITGFTHGRVGTKREATFGAITFETDDGQVKGQTSGFTDAQLEDFNSRRDELIGKIMTVQFNDVTKGRNSEHWALSHPRFIELRPERDDTDTFDRIQESKQMAMMLS